MNKILAALRNLFRRDHVERDLDAEVRSYAELLQEEKMSQGMNPIEARRAARMDLGGPEQLKEEIRAARAGAWLESLWQDLRFGARVLRKNPGFTAVAVLTLALGIGANTAVFSVVNAVVLRPLPYKDSSRLVNIYTRTAMFPGFSLGISPMAMQQIHQQAVSIEDIGGYKGVSMNFTQMGDPAQLSVTLVSGTFFEVLGATPQQGRLFVPDDLKPGHGQTAVLSDALWRTRFGGDSSVVGRSITLDKKVYTIVGVAPRRFAYPNRTDAWIPLVLTAEEQQNPLQFNIGTVAKLRQGAALPLAQTELATIAQRLIQQNPPLKDGYELYASTLLDERIQGVRSAYLMLFGAAGFVLLIACANLASMLLSRGWGRQREMALRAALGASRGRIIRQTLVESCLLALLGATFGVALAIAGIKVFRAIAPPDTPRLTEIAADPAMLWFALGSALIAGVLFGLAPAWRASRMDPNSALKDGAAGNVAGTGSSSQPRLGGVLVVVEVALAFVLLIGAVITTEAFSRLIHMDTGMRTDHLLTFEMPPAPPPHKDSGAAEIARLQDVLQRIKALPGVEDVAASDHSVLEGNIYIEAGIKTEGTLPGRSAVENVAHVRYVSPSFFSLLGVHMVRGRNFTEHDVHGGQLVVIVNEAMARQWWGTVDIVGKKLTSNKGAAEIVGVIADIREVGPASPAKPEFYLPLFQADPRSFQIFVRTAGDPNALSNVISRQVWNIDKDQPITDLMTMDHAISEQVGQPRLHAVLLGVFAAIGLALALLGVYGVVAYSVSRRTREIGIRVALGAQSTDVLRMIVRQGLVLAAIGVAIGAAAAIALSRLMANAFFSVKSIDPAVYVVAGVLVIFVACLACYVPARRAMGVDPMVALRHE